MYHPLAMDQIRVQQEQLRRQSATAHWSHETIENPQRRQWWPRPRRSVLRLAFAGAARRTTTRPCVDC